MELISFFENQKCIIFYFLEVLDLATINVRKLFRVIEQ